MNSSEIIIELTPDVLNSGESNEEIFLEPILNNFTDSYLRGLMYCLPAVIMNVQGVEELRLDVKPLNKIRHKDNTVTELPLIQNVPVFCYGTEDSAFLFPFKQGQTVLLLFSQLSLDEFKGGSTDSYSALSNRKCDIQDAIALPSIFPFNRSPNRKIRHYTDHSVEDLTVVHNLGTSRENKVVLKRSGSISINSPSLVDIDSPLTKMKDLDVDGLLNVTDDVVIGGRSVKTFMDTHTHNYTDNGSLMTTAMPNPT